MSCVHRIELDWIACCQGDGHLRLVMTWLSYLGSEAFVFVLPFVYFFISRRAGARLYLLLPICGLCLHVLKLAFHSPRPFWMDSRIAALGGSAGYGLPSGHVLAASVVWPLLAQSLGKTWAWFGAVIVVLLVSVSRVYLGVHFISDVVAAWAIGAALVWLFEYMQGKLTGRFSSWSTGRQASWALWATAAYWLIAAAAQSGLGNAAVLSARLSEQGDLRWLCRSSGAFCGAAETVQLWLKAKRWGQKKLRLVSATRPRSGLGAPEFLPARVAAPCRAPASVIARSNV